MDLNCKSKDISMVEISMSGECVLIENAKYNFKIFVPAFAAKLFIDCMLCIFPNCAVPPCKRLCFEIVPNALP